MTRPARIAGWTVFVGTLAAVGAIAFVLLGLRSPLADGRAASGPEPTAYLVVAGAVLVGAAVAGAATAGLVEAIVRIARR